MYFAGGVPCAQLHVLFICGDAATAVCVCAWLLHCLAQVAGDATLELTHFSVVFLSSFCLC
jgi:hypothetical protein